MASLRVTTLLYHDVAPEGELATTGFQGPGATRYKLDAPTFYEHRAALSGRAGLPPPILVPHLSEASPSADPWLFTVDDGGVSSYAVIAPALEEVGWRGHFFVTTDRIDTSGFLTVAHVRELHVRGHIIGSHTESHPQRMSHCSRERLSHEWRVSCERLAEILGERVDVASVPGGYYSERVATTAAAAGIRYLFNSEPIRRPRSVHGCEVFGRFCVRSGTSLRDVVGLVAGERMARARQWLAWNSRKVVKRLGGGLYLDAQRVILESATRSRPDPE